MNRLSQILPLLEREVEYRAVRSRGPGGQNVNKVSSAALLIWDFQRSFFLEPEEKMLLQSKLERLINADGQIQIRSESSRDLPQNKQDSLKKLEGYIRQAFFVPKKRTATKPTWSSKVRRVNQKTHRGEIKKLRGKVK